MATRRALISVWDKRDLIPFGQGLVEQGFELVSTGGTAAALRAAGLPVIEVSEITDFPEILEGRVKTLHPKVHGGLLARRDQPAHMEQLTAHDIQPIDLVVVNLYPFEATACKIGVTEEELVENIDIGGVALLRAGAKNFAGVTVVCDPGDYAGVLEDIKALGDVPLPRRQALAVKAFGATARYDTAISTTLAQTFAGDDLSPFPSLQPLLMFKLASLRYGENPHQDAALYSMGGADQPLGGRQLQGKELSYNNLLDLDAAWRMAQDFDEPAVAIIKHSNPCGLAIGNLLTEAFAAALACDPVSAYGSVIAVNRPFDELTAQALGDLFVEAIAAPAFTPAALEVLRPRTNCRLLQIDAGAPMDDRFMYRSVRGGMLVQEHDAGFDEEWTVVSERAPTTDEERDLHFAWRVAKHVKSNAIVFAKGGATVGIGAGQMSRVDSVRIASFKAGDRSRGSVLASDAYFPFADGLQAAIEAGVTAAVEPGGSVRDNDVIATANAAGIALIFTGRRHFRH